MHLLSRVSMESVLVGLNIILQEDLDFLVHLWPYVLQKECCDQGNNSKCNRGVGDHSVRH